MFPAPPWMNITAENTASIRGLLFRSGGSSFHALEAETQMRVDLGDIPVAGIRLTVGDGDASGHHPAGLAEFQAWGAPVECEDSTARMSRFGAFRAGLQQGPAGINLAGASLVILEPAHMASMEKCSLRYKLRGVSSDQRKGHIMSEFRL